MKKSLLNRFFVVLILFVMLTSVAYALSSDTTKPKVKSMSVSPSSVYLGDTVTVSYSVQDNIALKQVELWYKAPGGNWNAVPGQTKSISGTSASGSFSPHKPSKAGTNYYGIHVVDKAGNWDSEGSAGPKTVEVKELVPTLSTAPASGTKYGSICATSAICNSVWNDYLLVGYLDRSYRGEITIQGNNLDKVTTVTIEPSSGYTVRSFSKTKTSLTLKVSANSYDTKPSPSVTITLNGNPSLTKTIKVIPGFNDYQLYGQCTWYAWHIARLQHGQKEIINYNSGIKMQESSSKVNIPKAGAIIMNTNCLPSCSDTAPKHTAYVESVTQTENINSVTREKTVTYTLKGKDANRINRNSIGDKFEATMIVKISADGKTTTITKYPVVFYEMKYIYIDR